MHWLTRTYGLCKQTYSADTHAQTHIQGDIQGETYARNEVEEDSTELKANLVLKESSRWKILFDKGFKTAYHCEGPVEQSRATAPNKPLLRAQQTFSCFLFKGSHANTLHSPPNQSSQTVCVCVYIWANTCEMCVACACVFACACSMCLYVSLLSLTHIHRWDTRELSHNRKRMCSMLISLKVN